MSVTSMWCNIIVQWINLGCCVGTYAAKAASSFLGRSRVLSNEKQCAITHTHTDMHTHMYTHVHTCTHMYTHVHTCTHMYTHVHIKQSTPSACTYACAFGAHLS